MVFAFFCCVKRRIFEKFGSRYINDVCVLGFMKRRFSVIIEQDEDGVYVGRVPELKGCISQGDTLDELMKNIKEAIELCLEVRGNSQDQNKFIGIREVEVV
jgi:predicted RNase H-like HicB family nuclease